MVLAYLLIAISIVTNGFFAGMFLIFALGGLSNHQGVKLVEHMVWAELALLLALYVGAIVLGTHDHPVWACLLPCASVPLLIFTLDIKRRALRKA